MQDEFISQVFSQEKCVKHSPVAVKILEALDVRVLDLMFTIQAKNFLHFRDGLSFMMRDSINGANYCKITAVGNTYSIRFVLLKIDHQSVRYTTKYKASHIRAATLCEIFSQETGYDPNYRNEEQRAV